MYCVSPWWPPQLSSLFNWSLYSFGARESGKSSRGDEEEGTRSALSVLRACACGGLPSTVAAASSVGARGIVARGPICRLRSFALVGSSSSCRHGGGFRGQPLSSSSRQARFSVAVVFLLSTSWLSSFYELLSLGLSPLCDGDSRKDGMMRLHPEACTSMLGALSLSSMFVA